MEIKLEEAAKLPQAEPDKRLLKAVVTSKSLRALQASMDAAMALPYFF